ncbi:hypothetical protein [Paenibacillus amylolyticus]|nr:hypothetical protein [Paenibacillus amylolyticus]WFA84409.1 hypothetical protein OGI70_26305 [Paenibacillus amylolyticus]
MSNYIVSEANNLRKHPLISAESHIPMRMMPLGMTWNQKRTC